MARRIGRQRRRGDWLTERRGISYQRLRPLISSRVPADNSKSNLLKPHNWHRKILFWNRISSGPIGSGSLISVRLPQNLGIPFQRHWWCSRCWRSRIWMTGCSSIEGIVWSRYRCHRTPRSIHKPRTHRACWMRRRGWWVWRARRDRACEVDGGTVKWSITGMRPGTLVLS